MAGPAGRHGLFAADGTIRHATAVVTGIRNDEGEVTSIVVEGHDDTERRQHEFGSREKRATAASTGCGSHGRMGFGTSLPASSPGLTAWSRCMASPRRLRWHLSSTFSDSFIHPDDRELVNAAIQHAIEVRSTFDVEFRNVWQNGAVHWVAGSGRVFVDEQVRDRNDRHRPGRDGAKAYRGNSKSSCRRERGLGSARRLRQHTAKGGDAAVPHFADWASVDVLEANGISAGGRSAHTPAKSSLPVTSRQRFPPDPNAPTGVWIFFARANRARLPYHGRSSK